MVDTLRADILFADHSFPDARRCLEAAAPDLAIGIRGDGAETWQAPILVPLMSRIGGLEMDRVDGLRLIQPPRRAGLPWPMCRPRKAAARSQLPNGA